MTATSGGEHQWVGATNVPLGDAVARQAKRRGTARIQGPLKVDILEVYCAACRRPYDAVNGTSCQAGENKALLIGGPTGERPGRRHPNHDCARYGCTKGDGAASRAAWA